VNLVDARVGPESPGRRSTTRSRQIRATQVSSSRPANRRSRGGFVWTCPDWSRRSMGRRSTTSRRLPTSWHDGRFVEDQRVAF